MSSVVFLPLADDDLLEAWLHIATDNPIAADGYLDRIHQVCVLLADNPEIGVNREEFLRDVRSYPFENHVIFYVAKNSGIAVLRVWPARQDPRSFEINKQ